MKNKRVLAHRIANRLIQRYDFNIFPNHMAKEIMIEMNKFEDENDVVHAEGEQ